MISTSEGSAASRLGGEPARFNTMERVQLEAKRRARELAAPSRRDERWRFADIKRANLPALDVGQPVAVDLQGLRGGVSCLSLTQAMERDAARVNRLLDNLRGPLGSDYFMAHALGSQQLSVQCLWVEAGVSLEEPVVLNRMFEAGEGTGSALTLVMVEPGASVSLLERLQGAVNSRGNLLLATGLDVGRGGRVAYVCSQELPRAMNLVQCAHLELNPEGYGELAWFNAGASWVRQEASAVLGAERATARLLGLNLVQGEDQLDQHTRQRHSQPHGTSDLLFKNAIFDQGKATFGGLIQVEEGAHYTDAYQSCRNLLLSDEAEANAMPGLEIHADQVRCSHGATTGRMDPEELFYLKARGIPEEAARQLITLGFACEVVDRVSHPQIREVLRERVEGVLRRRTFVGG